jgi:hypothetical protein
MAAFTFEWDDSGHVETHGKVKKKKRACYVCVMRTYTYIIVKQMVEILFSGTFITPPLQHIYTYLFKRYEIAVDGKSEDSSHVERQLSKGNGQVNHHHHHHHHSLKRKLTSHFHKNDDICDEMMTSSSSSSSSQRGIYVNMRELAFERAAAMVASWPYVLLNKYHVEEMASHRPYLGVSVWFHMMIIHIIFKKILLYTKNACICRLE